MENLPMEIFEEVYKKYRQKNISKYKYKLLATVKNTNYQSKT